MLKHSSLFEKISKYLIAAVLIIVPLFPKFPLFDVPGTYVAIRLEDLLILSLGVLTLVKVLPNIRSFLKDEIVRAFLIFFGVGLVSLLAGSFLTQTVTFQLGALHLLRRVEYVVPFFAGITLLAKETVSENLNFYIKLLMIVVFAAFLYGIGERYFHFPVIITQNEEYSKGIALRWTPGSHINATFAGHYDLAAYLVLVLPILITLAALSKEILAKLLLIAAGGSGFWLLINSLSRTGQISYLLAVSAALALARKFKALAIVLIISAVIMGASTGVAARFQRFFDVFLSSSHFSVIAADTTIPAKRVGRETPQATPTPVFEDRSASIRLAVEWPRALRAFSKNPLIGTGYSSIGLATDSDYLRMLGEVGILGFMAFFLIFLRLGKTLAAIFPIWSGLPALPKAFIAGVMGGVVGTLFSAFFIDLFEASKFATIFWLLMGFAVYMVRNKEYVQ